MAEAKWTPDAVIAAIQELKRKNYPLHSRYVQPEIAALYLEACKQFGGWQQALRAASFGYRRTVDAKNAWTKKRVIETIQKMHRENKPLNTNSVVRTQLYQVSYKYCGGWRQAVTAAGIDYDSVRLNAGGVSSSRHKWSREIVVAEILRRHQQGLSLSSSEVNKTDSGLVWAARFHFGKNGWAKALTRAGFEPRRVGRWNRWPKEKIIQTIQQRQRKNLTLSSSGLRKTGAWDLMRAAIRAYGRWEIAITAAGLDYATIRLHPPGTKRTTEEVLQEIRDLAAAGVAINLKAIGKTHSGLLGVVKRRFGAWGAAVSAAGLDYVMVRLRCTRQRPWTAEEVLRTIRELAAKYVSLKTNDVRNKYSSLHGAGKRLFGTWPRAVKTAGIDYSKYEYHRVAYPVERAYLPRNWVSLDEPLGSDTETTRAHFFGLEDPGFAQADTRQMLQAILDKRKLASDMAALVKRLILGEDLEDSEYEALASAIKEHSELMKLLETT